MSIAMTTTTTLATRLRQFADAGKYCDVTLLSSADNDERRFACHKVVLLASGLLRPDLATGDDQLRNDVSEVTVDCSSRGLGHVVKFAYSNNDDDEGAMKLPAIDERNVFHCLQASRVLSVKQIEEKCVEWLRTSMGWFLPVGGAFQHLDHFASLMSTLEHHRDLVTTKSDVTAIESDSLAKVGEELEAAYRTACLMTLDYVTEDAENVPPVAVEAPTPVEEASNPFGDEEEEEEAPEPSAVVVPEPKARTSSNPFGDEEAEEEEEKAKSRKASTNPFGEDVEEEEEKTAPTAAETKPFNPFGEEEEDVVDNIQPTAPTPPKPKARSRSALASTNSNELPVPTPPPRRPSSPAPRKKAAPKPPSPAPPKKETPAKQETPAKPATPKAASSSKSSSLSLKNATFPKMKSLSKVLKSKSGDKEKSSTLGKTPTTTTAAAATGKTPPPRPKPPTIVKKSGSKEKEESSNPFE